MLVFGYYYKIIFKKNTTEVPSMIISLLMRYTAIQTVAQSKMPRYKPWLRVKYRDTNRGSESNTAVYQGTFLFVVPNPIINHLVMCICIIIFCIRVAERPE